MLYKNFKNALEKTCYIPLTNYKVCFGTFLKKMDSVYYDLQYFVICI